MNLSIRTKKREGETPLFTKVRVGQQVVWVNLKMRVDICKWNDASKTNTKRKNYLERLGHYRKLQDIEFAIQDLKNHNRLSKETIEAAVQDVVLADVRERVKEEKKLAKETENHKKNNVKNFLIEYVDGINNGLVRTNNGENIPPTP